MKRFIAFGGDTYYACGGMYDIKGDFDSLEDALIFCLNENDDWYHIYDSEIKKIVDLSYNELHRSYSTCGGRSKLSESLFS